MKFDITKPIQYRNGQTPRVLATDLTGKYPIATRTSAGGLFIHTEDGLSCANLGESDYDLVNIPQKIKVEFWVNVFNGLTPSFHLSRIDADSNTCGGRRIACLYIAREITEGEGL